jgi:uroporphyrinogen decarboxylase
LLAEHEIYSPDILTIGIDVYNIEPEAIGCKVHFYDGLEVPNLQDHILNNVKLNDLKIPDPEKDGRMPLIIEAARKLNSKIGKDIYICVAVSGPFSLATGLIGLENILFAIIEQPEYIEKVLNYCLITLKKYTESIIKAGLEVIVFDSAVSPPMISPKQYKNIIFSFTKDLFDFLKSNNCKLLSYIVGGNTEGILESTLCLGANTILCDFNADLDLYLEKSKEKNVLLRKNINPAIFSSSDDEILKETAKILKKGKSYSGFILGTGILQYNTKPEKVQLVRRQINSL